MKLLDRLNPHAEHLLLLKDFRNLVVEYQDVQSAEERIRAEKLPEIKRRINERLTIARTLAEQSGASTSIHYSPPPIIGGLSGRFDTFNNFFNDDIAGIYFPSQVLEAVDRAIGVQEHWRKTYWKYWLNPFNWITELIRIPFRIIRFAGFNGNKAEESLIGKFYKLITGFVFLLAATATILGFLGVQSTDLVNVAVSWEKMFKKDINRNLDTSEQTNYSSPDGIKRPSPEGEGFTFRLKPGN